MIIVDLDSTSENHLHADQNPNPGEILYVLEPS